MDNIRKQQAMQNYENIYQTFNSHHLIKPLKILLIGTYRIMIKQEINGC